MPFAAQAITEEDNLKNKEKNGVNVSGESTSFSTGVPGQEATSKPQSGSGDKFANIQSYLDANQPQGEQMGARIQSGVTANAEDASQKINSFSAKAPKVEVYDPTDAYSRVTSLTDADKATYNQNKAGYKGPQTLDQVDGYAATQKAVGTAQGQVTNAGTESGQRELLKETYKRPSYTGGENALDQTIVQNAPNSRKGFEDLTQKYSNLSGLFDTAATGVGQGVNSAVSQGLANQRSIAEGEQRETSGLINPIRQRAQDMNANNPAVINRINQDAGDETLSEETLAALGLSEGRDLLDLNLQKYITPNYTQVGANNVATKGEREKYAALAGLINDPSMNEINGQGQEIKPVTFNQGQFDSDFAQRNTEVQKAMNDFRYSGRSGWTDFLKTPSYDASRNILESGLGRLLDEGGGHHTSAKYAETMAKLKDLQNQGLVARQGEVSGYNLDSDARFAAMDAVQDLNNQYKDTNLRNKIGVGRTDRKVRKG